MIIYTNEGNPLGLQLLMLAKFAKRTVQVQLVNLNGKIKKKKKMRAGNVQRATLNHSKLMQYHQLLQMPRARIC